MPDFVHLHLHTEYSLLDGACRIGELLDQAAKRKMPALAVTEHGNMFSSVVFHDKARQKGIKPILGCETYVAPGSRHDKGGPISESNNHLVLLAENDEGYRNLIKLVSAGIRRGLLLPAAHRQGAAGAALGGADRPQQLPQGRGADAPARRARAAGDRGGLDVPRHPGPRATSSSRCSTRASTTSGSSTRACCAWPGPQTCRSSARTTSTTCTGRTPSPHDILLCIGTGKTVNEAEPDEVPRGPVLPEEPRGDVAGLRRPPGGPAQHRPRSPSGATSTSGRRSTTCRTSTCPAGYTLDEYFEQMVWEGFDAPAAAARAHAAPPASCATRSRSTATRVQYEIRMIKQMKYAGYFLIVWDFIRYAKEHGIPVGPGPRVGGRQRRRLVPGHHRRRSAALRPDLRALPQPRARVAARHRHRLLRAAPRRGDRVRHAEVRPRERRADHHVRHDEGEGRRARRRPRARHPVRRRGQGRQADSRRAGHDARQGAGGEPRAEGARGERRAREGAARGGPAPRGPVAPRLGPRRRRRHRAQGDHRVRAALQGRARRNHDAVEHEGDRADRSPQDGLPRPEHAHAARRRGGRDQADDRRDDSTSTTLPLDDAKTYQLFSEGQTLGVFQFESSGMREILRKAKPQRLEDLIALNALYRPGPLRGGMVDDFIGRKHGKIEVKYDLPQLEPILRDTYGVIAYQEQVMRVANVVAGFTPRRGRPAAQGDGEEERRRHAGAAPEVPRRREGTGRAREEGQGAVRPDGGVRRATASTSRTRRPTRWSPTRRAT